MESRIQTIEGVLRVYSALEWSYISTCSSLIVDQRIKMWDQKVSWDLGSLRHFDDNTQKWTEVFWTFSKHILSPNYGDGIV